MRALRHLRRVPRGPPAPLRSQKASGTHGEIHDVPARAPQNVNTASFRAVTRGIGGQRRRSITRSLRTGLPTSFEGS